VNGPRFDPEVARYQTMRWTALHLLTAGRGRLRAHTCDNALRVVCGASWPGQALIRRALLLFAPKELPDLDYAIIRGPLIEHCAATLR
jgi:hypothetical protein